MFNAEATCRYTLPGDDPKTVIVYRPWGQEDAWIAEGLVAEINKGESAVGRETNDPAAMKKKAASQRAMICAHVVQIENLHEPGDVVTDEADIAALINHLPEVWCSDLHAGMRTALSLFEGKA